MFTGASAALVTPFRDGEVDLEAVRRLTRHLVAGGLDGIVPLGCTGEAATLTSDERQRILETVLEEAGGAVFVLAGAGSNSTAVTIELTRMAERAGANGAMLITPYYNKPTPAGIERHYRAVADAVGLPLVLYNVPGRTGVRMTPETVARLADIDQVVAIKEACGSVDQVSDILCRTDLTVLSGDDSLTLPLMAAGARGVISVVANLYPAAVKALVDAAACSELAAARAHHLRLFPVIQALFSETNPGPVKCALSRMGLIENELRLPLVPVSSASARRVEAACEVFEAAAGSAV